MTCPLSGSPNIVPIAWQGLSGKTLRLCGGSGQKLEVPIDSLETCSDDFQPELEAPVAEYPKAEVAKYSGRPSP